MTVSSRITRSRTDRLVSGVCGGLARYFGLDSVIVRGVFVVLGLINLGIVAIAYLAAIVLLPEESETGAATQAHPGWRYDPWTGEKVSTVESTPPAPMATTPAKNKPVGDDDEII
jgi:phage shock protein C